MGRSISCSHDNKHNPNFVMTAHCDAREHIHIHFSLTVSIKLAGKKLQMEMTLVVPPDADFASASTPRPISSIDDLSHDASAIHEAGLSNSQHLFLLQFNLTTKGFVITKEKTAPIIRPSTTTTNKLIRNLESLSNTTIFSIYISQSTYAEIGLEKLRTHLSNTCTDTDTRETNIKEKYIQQGAMLVEWSRFVDNTHHRHHILSHLRKSAIAETIPETPTRTPVSPNLMPAPNSIFSPNIEESLDIEEDLRYVAEDFDVDSDEERLANLNARELSQQ